MGQVQSANRVEESVRPTINIQSTLETFEPERYQGRWFEIARLPNDFERSCIRTMALYQWKKDKMMIQNKCSTKNGDIEMGGVGVSPDKKFPGKLEVTFSIGQKGQYWVYWTNYDKWAIVGNQNKSYFWILSRSLEISIEDFSLLVMYSRSIGFNLRNLIVIPGAVIGKMEENEGGMVLLEERKEEVKREEKREERRGGNGKEKRNEKTRFSSDFSN